MFAAGCIIYSATVTIMNYTIRFEGILAFLYGVIVPGYGIAALKGRFRELLNAALLWVVIVATGSLGAYGAIGIMTRKTLAELRMMQGGLLLYTAATVSAVKFFMGRIANADKGQPPQSRRSYYSRCLSPYVASGAGNVSAGVR